MEQKEMKGTKSKEGGGFVAGGAELLQVQAADAMGRWETSRQDLRQLLKHPALVAVSESDGQVGLERHGMRLA